MHNSCSALFYCFAYCLLQCELELVAVAYAYVYYEKLVLMVSHVLCIVVESLPITGMLLYCMPCRERLIRTIASWWQASVYHNLCWFKL